MSKNLITGIGGFVASHLADYLLANGEEVIGTCRKNSDLKKIGHIREKINLIQMDLLDCENCLQVFEKTKPDYVHHLAAMAHVPECEKNPRGAFETNAGGTINILESIRKLREKDEKYNPIIHICSSGEVYGVVKKENLPINESNTLNPANIYGHSKISAEFAAKAYNKKFGLKTIVTRTFSNTGPRRTQLSAEVNFARQIALIEKGEQEPVISHGNLDSIRTWMDVRDCARAYYLIVRRGKSGETYNLAGNEKRTIEQVLEFLINSSPMEDKITKKINLSLVRKDDIPFQEIDSSKFRNETSWVPEIPFEQTMNDLFDWWREEVKIS